MSTRRHVLAQAALAAFGISMGKYDALAQEPAGLRVPLDQWRSLSFDYRGRRVVVPVGEVFAALEAEYGATPIKRGT